MTLRCVSAGLDIATQRNEVQILAGMSIDVSPEVVRTGEGGPTSLSVIETMPAEGGPCDRGLFGEKAIDPGRAVPTDAARRVPIESKRP